MRIWLVHTNDDAQIDGWDSPYTTFHTIILTFPNHIKNCIIKLYLSFPTLRAQSLLLGYCALFKICLANKEKIICDSVLLTIRSWKYYFTKNLIAWVSVVNCAINISFVSSFHLAFDQRLLITISKS